MKLAKKLGIVVLVAMLFVNASAFTVCNEIHSEWVESALKTLTQQVNKWRLTSQYYRYNRQLNSGLIEGIWNKTDDSWLWKKSDGEIVLDKLADCAWQIRLIVAEATRFCGGPKYQAKQVVDCIAVMARLVRSKKGAYALDTKDCEKLGKFLAKFKLDLTKKDARGKTPLSVVREIGDALKTYRLFIVLKHAEVDFDLEKEVEGKHD